MALKKLSSLAELNKLILDNPGFYQNQGVFLQSGWWQKIWQQEKKGFIGYAFFRGNNCLGLISASLHQVKAGISYLYCPKGPLFIGQAEEAQEFLEELIKEIRKMGVSFIRFEPASILFDYWHSQSHQKHFKKVKDVQPAQTIQLDLSRSEAELLAAMHAKTRYNIRLAEKKNIDFVQGGPDDFTDFWHLISTTAERDSFRLHGEEHYKILLNQPDFIKLFFVRYQKRMIAAGLFSFFADTVTYLHGASSSSDRNLMAPYLMQWEVIKQAKREGYQYYDFYGIDEKRWPGVTRFKSGFGGKKLVYPGTYDLILKPWVYIVYSVLKRLKP